MPSLHASVPGLPARVFPLYKATVSIGRGAENDVVLDDPEVADAHFQIRFDGRDFNLVVVDEARRPVLWNGRARSRQRLAHEDVLRAGGTELRFSIFDESGVAGLDPGDASRRLEAVGAWRRVAEFSTALLQSYDLPVLLEGLMDAVIAITRADKGFLLIAEGGAGGALEVKVARNLRRENIVDAAGQHSDSIVEKAVQTRRPIIVSDALHHAEFAAAMSVMSLHLTSVMCVPLLERGEILGVIYVGNDSVTNLFDRDALDVLTVFAAQASLVLRNALLVNELRLDNRALAEQLEQRRFGEIIGACAPMQEVFRKVQRVAPTDISVLVTGETGTGKELIAREIHARSGRVRGPFVTINCGAIPENLLESELFGHVRGAFTGAVANKPGRFQAAHGGTLFLDEVGELPLPLQVKLLRALQERVVTRVGDNRPEAVDIRIVAATNRDLDVEIREGRFREDLYYRLNVVNLHLPPLRERGNDIVVIARYLLQRFVAEYRSPARELSPAAVMALKNHPWPGNIRQLENHLKKAIVLADQTMLSPEDLGLVGPVEAEVVPLAEAKERFQRDYINEVLERNQGNRTKTARDLGVDPRTIFRHLEREDGEPGP